MIQPLYYAFALPPDSALRGPVTQALIRITSEALWRDIRYRYLGE